MLPLCILLSETHLEGRVCFLAVFVNVPKRNYVFSCRTCVLNTSFYKAATSVLFNSKYPLPVGTQKRGFLYIV